MVKFVLKIQKKKIRETKVGEKNPNYGKSISEEANKKHSMTIQGITDEKNWNGFICKSLYPLEFWKIRP